MQKNQTIFLSQQVSILFENLFLIILGTDMMYWLGDKVDEKDTIWHNVPQ